MACIKDEKFRDKIKDYIIFKNLDKKYITLKDTVEFNYSFNTVIFSINFRKIQNSL